MAQFRGFTCDECGNVISNEQKQKYVERFEGSVANGEIVKDLCQVCMQDKIPEGVKLRPLRRRPVTGAAPDAATEAVAQSA